MIDLSLSRLTEMSLLPKNQPCVWHRPKKMLFIAQDLTGKGGKNLSKFSLLEQKSPFVAPFQGGGVEDGVEYDQTSGI